MRFPLPVSPLQQISNHPGTDQGISLFIKRDDLIHPDIQGSKARKLAAVLPLSSNNYPAGLLTFGGAFSNHLHAVAAAGRAFGFKTTGIIRGEYADLQNPSLRFCQENGMALHRIPKLQYDALKLAGDAAIRAMYPDTYILPEGGNTPGAVQACMDISREIMAQLPAEALDRPIYLCSPAGTGCTAAGMIAGQIDADSRVLVFPVSSHEFDQETIRRLLPGDLEESRFDIVHEYTYGGFARLHPPVMAFVHQFFRETNILPDPVYTAKMLFGVYDMLGKGRFPGNSTVVALHTGGLQGWDGFQARYGAAGTAL